MSSSRRNSVCGSAAIESLDWSEWWTDSWDGRGVGYLKVPRHSDGTVHRVYCRHSDTPRIAMRDDVLYWLVDERAYSEVGRHEPPVESAEVATESQPVQPTTQQPEP